MPSRPKRVSIRGRGADLFFGDSSPTPPSKEVAAGVDSPRVDELEPMELDQQSADGGLKSEPFLLARKQESKKASLQERTEGPRAKGRSANPIADIALDALWESMASPPTITNSFRYTEVEMSLLTDIIYDLGKLYGTKLSKQDVARLGLNVMLWDFEARGEASLVAQLASRRGRRRAG